MSPIFKWGTKFVNSFFLFMDNSVINNVVFTASKIRSLEKYYNKMIMEIVANLSLDTLVSLIKEGLSINEDQAMDIIDKALASGLETSDLFVILIEKLEEQGFLLRKVGLSKIIKEKLQSVGSEVKKKM